jgi:hypothetical protein
MEDPLMLNLDDEARRELNRAFAETAARIDAIRRDVETRAAQEPSLPTRRMTVMLALRSQPR